MIHRETSLLLVYLLAFGLAFVLLSCTISVPLSGDNSDNQGNQGSQGNQGDNNTSTTLSGKYTLDGAFRPSYIIFGNNDTFSMTWFGNDMAGTYWVSASGSIVTLYITSGPNTGVAYRFTILSSTRLRDPYGDFWDKE